MTDEIILFGVGDIAPDREDPATIFQEVKDIIRGGDVSFCQLEANLSERGTPLPQARLASRGKPQIAKAIKDAGFNVVSFASNHCMDWGREAFFDTIENLRKENLHPIGVGENIEEARRPAIIECKGARLAFLAYNTILPQNYWADVDRPGCVPLRGFTFYEQIEHDQPGTPCRIHTFPHRGDLQAMQEDIKKAKAAADIVIVSMHWGIHFVPAVLADYQRDMGYAAIDSGADLILGHHAHILKGIEVYRGKVIFYSLSNFALDLRPTQKMMDSPAHQEILALNPEWLPDPEYPSFYMPPDCRKTIVAKCIISNKKIKSVSFLPAYINKRSQPEVLQSSDERFGEVVEYIKHISSDQNLETNYTVRGNEVIIYES